MIERGGWVSGVRGERISSKYISEVTLNEKAYILKVIIRIPWFYSKYAIYREKHEKKILFLDPIGHHNKQH